MAAKILFSETQRFKQWWLWAILIFAAGIPFFAIYHEMQKPEAFADGAVNAGLVLSMIVIIPLVALFMFIKLETRVTESGIAVKLFPLHLKFREFPWSEMEQIYVRKYSPLGEFGGWGLRYGFGGLAYNIAGNQGIQIVFKSGKKLLIGTQKPEEAAASLKQIQPVSK
ncbi:hypothetical protein I5M27_10840 [Adhaeribacter sp. BT258]|uniref:PH domain-containing protein n=1 Tax=Adhaeribacter terrigena TaxID=2793070 RepID=A0ABS1C261_9BACT|nr:hypothetical protein [Adhaeribacter terrigena]MBK0403483.1 hypothetical protein [Adhaeribacter terrigena]